MAIHCRNFSLLCLLVISAPGAAIAIVHGDREGHRRGQSTMSRGAVESGGYCAAKLPPHRTHYIEGAPAPTEAIRMRSFKANRPCSVSAGAEAAAMVDLADLKIEHLLVRNEPFGIRNAYFLRNFFPRNSVAKDDSAELKGKYVIWEATWFCQHFYLLQLDTKSVK